MSMSSSEISSVGIADLRAAVGAPPIEHTRTRVPSTLIRVISTAA
jgi:hypothetical protein